jgi:invasion protein IalB
VEFFASRANLVGRGRGRLPGRAALAVLVTTLCLAVAPAQAQKPPAAPAQAIPLPSSSTGRTEIVNYDNWTVTCRDGRDAKEKRVCSAQLDIVQEANGSRRAVFTWLIGTNKDGALAMAMRFLPGVAIPPGVELKLAEKPVRKIPITICEPTHCEASMTIDEAFIRDAHAVQQAEAVVTASDGRQVTFTVNMKGFAQAVAAVRK